MIGLVLSGGQSTRMGSDKGLLLFNEKIWAAIVHEKLSALSTPTFVSINPQQVAIYSEYFDPNDLVIDNPSLQIHGPLLGIMSTHLNLPNEDILVVACDMLKLESFVLEKLVDEYRHTQPEAMAFKGLNIEPLCAIYSSKGLKNIQARLSKQTLTKHSLVHVLEILNTQYLSIENQWLSYFKNFNQPEDVNEIID